jgi:hypothetical protein
MLRHLASTLLALIIVGVICWLGPIIDPSPQPKGNPVFVALLLLWCEWFIAALIRLRCEDAASATPAHALGTKSLKAPARSTAALRTKSPLVQQEQQVINAHQAVAARREQICVTCLW